VFSQKTKKLNPQQQMMSDPSMMTDMLKKNLNMIVPQMLTAGPHSCPPVPHFSDAP